MIILIRRNVRNSGIASNEHSYRKFLAVAELTLGYMLDFARHISVARQSMIEGRWDKKKFKGTELSGKTLGILGLGRIGGLVAERAKAFGMEIIAFDKYITKNEQKNMVLDYWRILKNS